MTLSAHDRGLWDALIAKVINPKIRDVAVIHRHAKRCARATMPVSEWRWEGGRIRYEADSPFLRLTALGRILPGGDDLARQVLCDIAHQCRAKLDGKPDPTEYPSTASRSPSPPGGAEKMKSQPSLPFRRDIDG